jgi:hypothetical protein
MDDQKRRKEVNAELLSKVLISANVFGANPLYLLSAKASDWNTSVSKIIHIMTRSNVMSKKLARKCITFLHHSKQGGNDA